MQNVKIIDYADKYAPDFRRLHLDWLDKYGLTESHDLLVLNDPAGTVIQQGGFIFLAIAGDEIVGSAALMKESEKSYELAKFAIIETWQGRGISKMLIEKCIGMARQLKAEKIILFSNHQLTTALKLYEKYGFRQVPVTGSPFSTADIKMELSL